MTPEGKVKAEIKKVLAEYGCWYFMPSMNGYGRAGIPDFIGCYNGVFFAIEAKSANGKLTPNQEREIAAIQQAHGVVVVAYSAEDVRRMLNAIGIQRKA
jgi:Holliday junction resolvase